MKKKGWGSREQTSHTCPRPWPGSARCKSEAASPPHRTHLDLLLVDVVVLCVLFVQDRQLQPLRDQRVLHSNLRAAEARQPPGVRGDPHPSQRASVGGAGPVVPPRHPVPSTAWRRGASKVEAALGLAQPLSPENRTAGHSPHLLLDTVLLSHDGFIVGKTVNTWKKEKGVGGGPWPSRRCTPRGQGLGEKMRTSSDQFITSLLGGGSLRSEGSGSRKTPRLPPNPTPGSLAPSHFPPSQRTVTVLI